MVVAVPGSENQRPGGDFVEGIRACDSEKTFLTFSRFSATILYKLE